MLRKDKYSVLSIIATILFISSLVAVVFMPNGELRNLAQVLSVLFAALAILGFFISKTRQQHHLSHILHSMVKSQTKLINDLEELNKHTPPAIMIHEADEAEEEMRKTVVFGLARARGEAPREIEIPEPTNENMELEDAGSLIILEEDDSQSEEIGFSSIDPQQLLLEVREALKEGRIEVLLQPVVSLPQRKLRFYECFSRLRTEDGSILVPDSYLPIAEQEGLISAVDNTLLFRCIQMVRKAKRHHLDIGFFCNISAASLVDATFFESLVEFMEVNPDLKPWLILEVQGEVIYSNNPNIRAALDQLATIRCSFSLDQREPLDIDTSRLNELDVRFVKISAQELSDISATDHKKFQVLHQKLEEMGIDVITTKVETESHVQSILDFNVDYGQGNLFSSPRICRI